MLASTCMITASDPPSMKSARSLEQFVDAVQVLVLLLAPIVESSGNCDVDAYPHVITAARRVLKAADEAKTLLQQVTAKRIVPGPRPGR